MGRGVAGILITLQATVRKGAKASGVQYCDGDRLIGQAAEAPWRFEWTQPRVGVRPVWAIWRSSDGTNAVSNPALIIVRRKALKEKKK